MAKLSQELNIATSTLSDWKKHAVKILKSHSEMNSTSAKNTKKLHFSYQPVVEKYLIQWFKNMQNQQHSVPILKQLLQAPAKIFAKELGV